MKVHTKKGERDSFVYSLRDYFKDIENNNFTHGNDDFYMSELPLVYNEESIFHRNYESVFEGKPNRFQVKRDLDPINNTRFPLLQYQKPENRGRGMYSDFFGPKDSHTPWHTHGPVYLGQFYGEKRVLLQHCDCEKWYREYFLKEDPVKISEACDTNSKGYEHGPCRIQEAILEAGDVL